MSYRPPVPIEMRRPAGPVRLRRLGRTGAVMGRHLGAVAVDRLRGRPTDPQAVARGLRRTFESLGATYVKFGQLVGSSPGAFGPATSDEFRSCLDQGPSVPWPEVRAAIESGLGRPVAEVFADIDCEPLAAASIAVVHRGRLHDGRDVAVKVLRPGIGGLVATDLDIMEPIFRRLALSGVAAAGPLWRFLHGFRRQVAEELDLRNEARTMVHFRQLFAEAELSSIVVPEPIDGLVAQNVLVMDFLDGVPIDDPARIAELGHDPKPLIQQLLRSWFLTGLRDGLFHGDIHAGNLMLLRDGRIGMLDWGIVGCLDDRTQRLFRRFVEGVLGDPSAWAEVKQFIADLMPAGDEDTVFGPPGAPGDDDDIARIEDMLTKPFGEVDLSGAFRGPVGPDHGRRLSGRERLARMRRIRTWRRKAADAGLFDDAAMQADFLLFKQLLYFERYGKMYLADTALLGDREYLQQVLDLGRRKQATT